MIEPISSSSGSWEGGGGATTDSTVTVAPAEAPSLSLTVRWIGYEPAVGKGWETVDPLTTVPSPRSHVKVYSAPAPPWAEADAL